MGDTLCIIRNIFSIGRQFWDALIYVAVDVKTHRIKALGLVGPGAKVGWTGTGSLEIDVL